MLKLHYNTILHNVQVVNVVNGVNGDGDFDNYGKRTLLISLILNNKVLLILLYFAYFALLIIAMLNIPIAVIVVIMMTNPGSIFVFFPVVL